VEDLAGSKRWVKSKLEEEGEWVYGTNTRKGRRFIYKATLRQVYVAIAVVGKQ
jgi:hypothetical protein